MYFEFGVTNLDYRDLYRNRFIRAYSRMACAVTLVLVGFLLGGCKNEPLATWHMINVTTGDQQGDAHLITIEDTAIMIDAGYYEQAEKVVLPYLESIGIKRIDHFFISHPHKDHYEGLFVLLNNDIEVQNLYFRVPPRHICDREIPWGCDKESIESLVRIVWGYGISTHEPSSGFTLDLPGNSRLEVLHAQEDDLPTGKIDVNDLSLIMKWFIDGKTVLFTGDLNMKVGSLLSKDSRMKADFLKFPHHGVESVAPDSFFDLVDPWYVFVPASASLWCSKLGERSRKWVGRRGTPAWVSGNSGHVTTTFHGGHTVISPQFWLSDEISAYEVYVREHADLAITYQATNGGKTMEDWGRWHWETHGQHEDSRQSPITSPYEFYVRRYEDLLTIYKETNGGKTMEDWGRWHWETHGQHEDSRQSPITSPYEFYVRRYEDLLTIYKETNGGKTMEDWGRWHWEMYGVNENNRVSPELLACTNKTPRRREWRD